MNSKQKIEVLLDEIKKRLDNVDKDPLQWVIIDKLLEEARNTLGRDDRRFDEDFRYLLGITKLFEHGIDVP